MNFKLKKAWLVASSLLLSQNLWAADANRTNFADLVFTNGRVVTYDRANPEATAIAVKGDKILAVGSDEEIAKYIGKDTKTLDIKECLLLPGFIEGHGHVQGIGNKLISLDLSGITSLKTILNQVEAKAKAKDAPRWIQGRGWDQNLWEVKKFPTAKDLDKVANGHPVVLLRVDGHALWANSEALKIAGITKDTKAPEGGEIIKDADGEPTGIFIDTAMGLIAAHVPAPSKAEKLTMYKKAFSHLAAQGVTTVTDAGISVEDSELIRAQHKDGSMPIKLFGMYRLTSLATAKDFFAKQPTFTSKDKRLSLRSVKITVDGALGSRGAALLEPYSDKPESKGLLIIKEPTIQAITELALKHGFQVAAHAIGDHANRVVLNAYEKAMANMPFADDPRLRIEHAQILDADDIPRFGSLGVIASIQATHCTSDMPWVPTRIGKERTDEGAYVWRKLLASGARVVGGSDAPVESANPLWGLYSSVTRQRHDGTPDGGWNSDQALTLYEAIASYTSEAAYAVFQEQSIGKLRAGMQADLVVLSKDVLALPAKELLSTEVVYTVSDGKIVFAK